MFDYNIVVVDDQRTMRSIVRNMLHKNDIHNVREAENGQDAIRLFQSIEGDVEKKPDLIICDLHMDKMDGLEFVTRIRKNKAHVDPLTPILILTGDHSTLIHEVTMQVGATKVLEKPISADDLLKEIKIAVGYTG